MIVSLGELPVHDAVFNPIGNGACDRRNRFQQPKFSRPENVGDLGGNAVAGRPPGGLELGVLGEPGLAVQDRVALLGNILDALRVMQEGADFLQESGGLAH